MRIEVIAVLVRLATVENRAFELEPAIGEASREHAERDVSGILQVVRECGRRIL